MRCLQLCEENKKEVETVLQGGKPVLVLYKMAMCPHCVALQPTWDDVKQKLARDPHIHLAEIEYQHIPLLPMRFRHIRGFPTLQMVHHGKIVEEYTGDRSSNSILSFATSHTPAPTKTKPAKPSTAQGKAKPTPKAHGKPAPKAKRPSS